jgi:hypothetical protein
MYKYKGIAQVEFGSGDSILFWADMWNGRVLELTYPKLYSFAINLTMTAKAVTQMGSLQEMF